VVTEVVVMWWGQIAAFGAVAGAVALLYYAVTGGNYDSFGESSLHRKAGWFSSSPSPLTC